MTGGTRISGNLHFRNMSLNQPTWRTGMLEKEVHWPFNRSECECSSTTDRKPQIGWWVHVLLLGLHGCMNVTHTITTLQAILTLPSVQETSSWCPVVAHIQPVSRSCFPIQLIWRPRLICFRQDIPHHFAATGNPKHHVVNRERFFFFDLGIVGVGYLGKLALGKKLHTHKCMFIDYVDYVPTCSYSILTKFDIEIKHVSTLHCLRGWSYAFCTSHGIVCGSSIICVSLDWHE